MKKLTTVLMLAFAVASAIGQTPRVQTGFATSTPSVDLSQPPRATSAVASHAPQPTPPLYSPNATQTTLFFEDFETTSGGAFPAGWTSITTPSGNAWLSASYQELPAHSGSRYALILYHATVAHNAWLITPAITLTAGTTYRVSFWLQIAGYQTAYEKLEVKIGNAATVAAMTTQLYVNETTNHTVWTLVTADYTPATSGNFYVGFHAYSPADVNFIAIDDISVVDVFPNDLKIVADYPYTQVPVSQMLNLSAKAQNIGTAAQTNVTLTAALNGTASGASTPVASLAPGATSANLTITPSLAVPVGYDTLVYTVSATQTDNNPADNSATFIFKGTQNTFAVDDVAAAVNGAGSNTGAITIGNIFTVTSATTLSQVMILFGDPATLNYSISLYAMTGDLTCAATALFTQTATRNATGISVVNVPATPLTPGSYFLCVNQLTATNISVSFDENSAKVLYMKSGNNLSAIAGFGALGIRMITAVNNCAEPTALTVVADYTSATFSWQGNAARYEMILNDGTQDYPFITTDNSIDISGMDVGAAYTWKVRALCDATHTSAFAVGTPFSTLSCAITTFPWNYGFEDDVFAVCWEQIQEAGTAEEWVLMSGDYGSINTAHSGAYNALFYYVSASVTKLVTPQLDLSGLTAPELKFWHTQAAWWSGDQDILRVYYKTSATGAWTLLATYSNNITAWTEETIALPNPSGDYYIAFEGTTAYGYGIALDDISVNGISSVDVGVLAITQPVSGADLTAAETVTITVKNFSTTAAVTAIPVTLEVNGVPIATETITASIPALTEQPYTFTATANLSAVQTHTLKAYTSLPNDALSSNDTSTVEVENTVGIIDLANTDNTVTLFPNPTNGTFHISASAEIERLTVYSPMGQQLLSQTVSDTDAQLNLSNLSAGLYVIRIQTKEGIATKRLLISK